MYLACSQGSVESVMSEGMFGDIATYWVFNEKVLMFFMPLPFSMEPASVAQLDARPTGDQEIAVRPPLGRQHSFIEIDHEIFSTVILSFQLTQEEQLSVSDKRMCTILVNC